MLWKHDCYFNEGSSLVCPFHVFSSHDLRPCRELYIERFIYKVIDLGRIEGLEENSFGSFLEAASYEYLQKVMQAADKEIISSGETEIKVANLTIKVKVVKSKQNSDLAFIRILDRRGEIHQKYESLFMELSRAVKEVKKVTVKFTPRNKESNESQYIRELDLSFIAKAFSSFPDVHIDNRQLITRLVENWLKDNKPVLVMDSGPYTGAYTVKASLDISHQGTKEEAVLGYKNGILKVRVAGSQLDYGEPPIDPQIFFVFEPIEGVYDPAQDYYQTTKSLTKFPELVWHLLNLYNK